MKTVEEREEIRRAHFLEHKSMRQIANEMKIPRNTVRDALENVSRKYTLRKPRPAPVPGLYTARIDEMLADNARFPRKQRYTSHRIYQVIFSEGYKGAESTVRHYVGKWRREHKAVEVYLPLEFDAGTDAQVDWGEAMVIFGGESVTVELFMMRLCYSRRLFVILCFGYRVAGSGVSISETGGIPGRTCERLPTLWWSAASSDLRQPENSRAPCPAGSESQRAGYLHCVSESLPPRTRGATSAHQVSRTRKVA